MSFTRFRKAEKSKASSVQSNQDYKDVRQQDNLSNYSHQSQNQYDYRQNVQPREKPQTQPRNFQKFNNDINNIQRTEKNSQNPSVTSSSSTADQYICNNCINDALIYEKQLNSRGSYYPSGENPLDVQDRLGALEREQINNRINQRQRGAAEAGKHLGEPTNKDKLIQQNEKGTFFLNNQQVDPQMKKVWDNYYKLDERNRGKKPYSDKPGVDDYYRNYVDNYKENYDYGDDDEKRNQQQKYNKALHDQIEANKRLRNKNDIDNKKYNDELRRQDDKFAREQEEEAKRLKDKQNEMYLENLNLIEAKRKKALNDKMLDEYDQKRNAANLKKQMEDEAERLRRQEDEKKRGWQKALDNQINEKNQLAQMERDRNNIPNVNAFTHEGHECCQNGKCCICKRIYPLAVLNPRKKYASLARIQKMRKQRENQKRAQKQGVEA